MKTDEKNIRLSPLKAPSLGLQENKTQKKKLCVKLWVYTVFVLGTTDLLFTAMFSIMHLTTSLTPHKIIEQRNN